MTLAPGNLAGCCPGRPVSAGFAARQIGSAAAGSLGGLLPPPLLNPGVMAGYEDVRYGKPAPLARSRVVGKIEIAPEEGVVLDGFELLDEPGDESGRGLDDRSAATSPPEVTKSPSETSRS